MNLVLKSLGAVVLFLLLSFIAFSMLFWPIFCWLFPGLRIFVLIFSASWILMRCLFDLATWFQNQQSYNWKSKVTLKQISMCAVMLCALTGLLWTSTWETMAQCSQENFFNLTMQLIHFYCCLFFPMEIYSIRTQNLTELLTTIRFVFAIPILICIWIL